MGVIVLFALALAWSVAGSAPSVGVDTSPLAPRWGEVERLALEGELLARLLERGHALAGREGAVQVELVATAEGVLVSTRTAEGSRVQAVSATGPSGIVHLEVMHRVLEAVQEVGAAAEAAPAARLRVTVASAGTGPPSPEALVALTRSTALTVVPRAEASDAAICFGSTSPLTAVALPPGTPCDASAANEAQPWEELAATLMERSPNDPLPVERLDPPQGAPAAGDAPEPGPASAAPPSAAPKDAAAPPPARRDPARWGYDVALAAGTVFRGIEPPASGFDAAVELAVGFTHRTGWGIGTTAALVPSWSDALLVLETTAAAGPGYQRELSTRVRIRVGIEAGAWFHHARFDDAPWLRRVDFAAAVPVRLSVRILPRWFAYVSLHFGFAHRGRLHRAPDDRVLWARSGLRGGLAVGLGPGGPLP